MIKIRWREVWLVTLGMGVGNLIWLTKLHLGWYALIQVVLLIVTNIALAIEK